MFNFAKLKNQLDKLVAFEKCYKTRIYLQGLVPIQPKTSEVLPNFCQKLVTTRPGPALSGKISANSCPDLAGNFEFVKFGPQ